MSPRVVSIASGLIALCVFTTAVRAQNRYEWTVYSALNSVQSVTIDNAGTVWAATTGGVVGYHVAKDSFEVHRTTDGLMTLNTTAIGVDPQSGALYAGADDGSISIRPLNGEWYGIADIAGISLAERRIRDFRFHDQYVYVLTAFGVGVFDPSDSTFPETWTRFGDIPVNTAVNDVLFWRDSIWVATDRGIARAPQRGALLPNPLSWTSIDTRSIGSRVHSLAVVDDQLIVGSDSGVYTRNDTAFVRRAEVTSRDPFRMAMNGSQVAGATMFTPYRVEGSTFREVGVGSPAIIDDIAVAQSGLIAIAVRDLGIGIVEEGTLRVVVPSAPASNAFTDIALGDDGSIWVVNADFNPNGRGVSRLKNERWEQFNSRRFPGKLVDGVQNVAVGGDGAIWGGTWGNGVVRIVPADSGGTAELLTKPETPLTGISEDPNFIIVGDAARDLRGRTWFLNWDPTVGTVPGPEPMLVVRVNAEEESRIGSRFLSFLQPAGMSTRLYRWIVVDQNGTKWIGSDKGVSHTASATGLYFFNENGTIDVQSDDDAGLVTQLHGLLNNQQTALAIDSDGAVWAGAPNGLSVIDNPTTIVSQGPEQARVRTSDRDGNCCRALRDVAVNAIAVDALNRKWIGTNQGIFVLSADGIDVVRRFTSENSPLVDDEVLSLLAVPSTGDIYVGTSNGLNRISTDAVESPEVAQQLKVWPQPFIIPDDESARFEGLPANSIVKILTLNGRLVRQFDSPGGAVAFWDGRDRDGAVVPSGVYIVAAGASSGNETVVGKIAVIRR